MSDVFYVVRTGVYDQGVFGIFDTLELARACATAALESEHDRHHAYEIRKGVHNLAQRFAATIDSDGEQSGLEVYEETVEMLSK